MKNQAFFTLIVVGALGCEDPLKPAERIDEPRVLGVRVSDAEGQATLRAGEPARAEILLAGPSGALTARVAYRLCEANASQRGVPSCAHEPFVEQASSASEPLSFSVPAAVAAQQRLAVLGVACPAGEPALAQAADDFNCSDGDAPLRFSFDAWTLGATPNKNPDLSALQITLGGETVAPRPTATPGQCDDQTLTVSRETSHRLRLQLGEAARENGESLQISHFSTRGKLERQYSFVTEVAPPRVELSWTAPRDAGPVTHYVVVRDGSGGVSWVAFHVCVN